MLRSVCLLAVAAVALGAWVDMWKFPWTGAPLEFMFGVSCPSAKNCFVCGGQSNTPTGVYYTEDDFLNVTRQQMDQTDLMTLSIAMGSATRGVAGGAGLVKLPAVIHTTNGKEWSAGKDLWLMTGQDVESIAGSALEYGYVGETNAVEGKQGVLYTADGGDLWLNRAFPESLINSLPGTVNCSARYGAFPTASTWYVSAGGWPATNNVDENVHYLNSHVGVDLKTKKPVRRTMAPQQGLVGNSTNGYQGALIKTTDAGQTWTVQYTTANDFYFNDIDCANADTCMAAGEGFAADGSTNPGARIMCTTDGGSTWTECLKVDSDPADSVMYVRMLSATEAWAAVGAADSQTKMQSDFYHTTDGGKTWSVDSSVKGVGEVMDIDMVDGSLGYATGLTDASVMTVIKYTA